MQDKKDAAGKYMEFTPEEQKEIKQFEQFKSHEQSVYKDLHSHILSDDGLPSLKKSAFKMPGYRAVAKDLEEGEIKHTLDDQPFEEIKELDSEEEHERSVDIVSDSSGSNESFEGVPHKNKMLSKLNSKVDVYFQNPVNLVDEHQRAKQQAAHIVDMMSQDSVRNNSPFVKKLKQVSEQAG